MFCIVITLNSIYHRVYFLLNQITSVIVMWSDIFCASLDVLFDFLLKFYEESKENKTIGAQEQS